MSSGDNVEVKQSEIASAGRGLFALKDFQPGDLVFAVDRPLVAEVDMDRMSDTCAWCFHRGLSDPREKAQAASMGLPMGFVHVKACTGCRRVSYCSKTCQTRAWKREHKHECKVLAPKERPPLPDGVRCVTKLLCRLKADPEGKNQNVLDILKFRPGATPKGLEDFSKNNGKLFEDLQFLSFASYKYAGEPKFSDGDAQAMAQSFLFNVMCNKFVLSSPLDDVTLGIGFDPLICCANHSCEPNTVLIFNQPQTALRALKPIEKGEEILLKYVDVTNPFSVRQEELKKSYYFNCQCAKCKEGATFPEDRFSKKPEELTAEYRKLADTLVKRHNDQLSKFFVPASDATAQERLAAIQAEAFSIAGTLTDEKTPSIDEIKGALEMCIQSGLWSWTRQPVPHLCRQLFGLYIASGDSYRAFRLGIKLHFQITPLLNPQAFYPHRLIDIWNMSCVANVLCGPMHQNIYKEFMESGIDLRVVFLAFLFDLHENIPKMYGLDSPFGKVVVSTYRQIMAGMNIGKEEIGDKIRDLWPKLETIARSVNILSL